MVGKRILLYREQKNGFSERQKSLCIIVIRVVLIFEATQSADRTWDTWTPQFLIGFEIYNNARKLDTYYQDELWRVQLSYPVRGVSRLL